MKSPLVLAVGLAAALTSCQQQEPAILPATPSTSAADSAPREAARAGQYLALPGESAVSVSSSDTDAAFEQQAAAYASQASSLGSAPAIDQPLTSAPAPAPDAAAGSAANPPPADIPDPAPVSAPVSPTAPASSAAATAPAPSADASSSAPTPGPSASGLMDYTVRITNGTPGRLFIEAQDAAGTIYPCGFMHQNRSYSTPMVQSAPISGPITVVVRDPDQPGAPEIRRYRVNPPANYAGKTIDITIIPGGMYEASVDGQVYYRTPPPPGAAPAVTPSATPPPPLPDPAPAS